MPICGLISIPSFFMIVSTTMATNLSSAYDVGLHLAIEFYFRQVRVKVLPNGGNL